jgi:methionine-S-sulfoxide reductase
VNVNVQYLPTIPFFLCRKSKVKLKTFHPVAPVHGVLIFNTIVYNRECKSLNKIYHSDMTKKIVLAGGCFWGVEDLIRTQPGVVNTEVGYTGGSVDNPTYEHHTGHAEAVEIEYDPEKTSYKKLLDFFFQVHNPTTLNQQGNDRGTSYRSAIFYGNEDERKEGENDGTILW